MRKIFEDLRARRIEKPEEVGIQADESGLYLIEISARTKSAKQLGGTDDEDLRIAIDKRDFPLLTNPERHLDSPASFSGGKLHNALQTIYLLTSFSSGKHLISLIPDKGGALDSIKVFEVGNDQVLHIELNKKAERANNRPWLVFVLVDVGLTSFTISADVEWRFPDGDDIKILVDGKVKKNPYSLWHKNWIFASNILRRIFSWKKISKSFTENLQKGLHYIEIWSDESPTIYNIELNFAINQKPDSEIKTYKIGPTGENYNRFDTPIKEATEKWNREFLNQIYPPPKHLDPNLIKAMVYVESRMGYGESSDRRPAYPDVMRVGDEDNPAVHTLRNDGWKDPKTGIIARENEWYNNQIRVLEYKEAKVKSPEESIYWGVRWLYHKAQKILNEGGRSWSSWEDTVENYNGAGDPEYRKKVLEIYKDGIDTHGIRLFLPVLIPFLFLALSTLAISFSELTLEGSRETIINLQTNNSLDAQEGKTLGEASVFPGKIKIHPWQNIDSENRLAFIFYEGYPAVGLAVIDNSDNIEYFLKGSELRKEYPYEEIKGPGEYIKLAEMGDFDGDGRREVIIQYIISGSGLYHPLYVYKEENGWFRLLLSLNDGASEAKLEDLNADGKKEILYSYALDATGAGPSSWTLWRDVWVWQGDDLVKSNTKFPNIYNDLVDFYDSQLNNPNPDSWLSSYLSVINCLKISAQDTIGGIITANRTCKRQVSAGRL